MSTPPQNIRLRQALWENAARAARRESIPSLSRILGHTVSPRDFTSREEVEAHIKLFQAGALREERFPATHRAAVLSRLRNIFGLGTPARALLYFGRSERLGGLRVPRTPPADTVMDLLDWDLDDVFVFDASGNLLVHVDCSEDWLEPEDFGSRQMLYIVNTPKT